MIDIMLMMQSPPHISSTSSSTVVDDNDGSQQQEIITTVDEYSRYTTNIQEVGSSGRRRERKRREREQEGGDQQVSLLAVLVTVFRKSLVACKSNNSDCEQFSSGMEISWPDNVRHVAHVTFDRFNGFLGLPVEFEPDVPRRPPSASVRVFGVSTESMQLSFDSRGNSVPTILLMMQRRLYSQGGLQAEGIFRINAENGQEEHVREQLNSGLIPDDIDVHCLAGLIKAWFRELPRGILDSLSSEQVMQAQTEDECIRLVRLLPPTEAALLDWAINLMADVAQLENYNKMNARNIAMVFAPNMTQMADPLTALMYAVQVMNFLKTLVTRTLRDREDSVLEPGPSPNIEPSDENGHYGVSQPTVEENIDVDSEEKEFITKKPLLENDTESTLVELRNGKEVPSFLSSIENILRDGKAHILDNHYSSEISNGDKMKDGFEGGEGIIGRGKAQSRSRRDETGQSSVSDVKRGNKKNNQKPVVHVEKNLEKNRDISIISRLNTQPERVEAWR